MKLFKKVNYSELSKNYLSLLFMIFFMNNLIAFGSENKSFSWLDKQKDGELEEIYKLNSIPYSNYDGLSGQLKTFFGLYSPKSFINN